MDCAKQLGRNCHVSDSTCQRKDGSPVLEEEPLKEEKYMKCMIDFIYVCMYERHSTTQSSLSSFVLERSV